MTTRVPSHPTSGVVPGRFGQAPQSTPASQAFHFRNCEEPFFQIHLDQGIDTLPKLHIAVRVYAESTQGTEEPEEGPSCSQRAGTSTVQLTLARDKAAGTWIMLQGLHLPLSFVFNYFT
jgi:hypothetical protein